MSYARISLSKGKPPEYFGALSDSLQRALVEAFEVPENDRFQIFHRLAAQESVFDRDSQCGPRSDNYMLIALRQADLATLGPKKRFFCALPNCRKQHRASRWDVMVVITATKADEWSFGDGVVTMVTKSDQLTWRRAPCWPCNTVLFSPPTYDMSQIRARISTKGHLVDGFPLLLFKACLHAHRDPARKHAQLGAAIRRPSTVIESGRSSCKARIPPRAAGH